MPHFFVERENICGERLVIKGSDAVHIGRSLRMRLGDVITVCCEGMEYRSKILTISDKEVECDVLLAQPSTAEPSIKLTLFQAMPKSDKLEFIVQKAVELGVTEIRPVMTARCISRPEGKNLSKRIERLNKIALEAAKQCGRGIVPKVCDLIGFDECVEMLTACDVPLMCYEQGGINLREAGLDKLEKGQSVGLFIGSEGGFEQHEAESCRDAGVKIIGLGERILRCETAPVAAASIIMSLTGNM